MNSNEVLTSILKTTQMGQIGVRTVLGYAVKPGLKEELRAQLREYDAIEQEAHEIASLRGWDIDDLDPAIKLMAKAYAHTNLKLDNTDSKIAAMMIQGNTRGMIKSLKSRHGTKNQDSAVAKLSQKLLECEIDNIRNMQGFV